MYQCLQPKTNHSAQNQCEIYLYAGYCFGWEIKNSSKHVKALKLSSWYITPTDSLQQPDVFKEGN